MGIQQHVGEVLLYIRLARGWTVDEAAARCGVEAGALQEWESASRELPVARLARIAHAYGTDAACLLREAADLEARAAAYSGTAIA